MIQYIVKLITNNIILSIATLVGTLVGILGIVDSKKSKKELNKYEYLFKIAEKNIDRDLTTEELEQLHKQKKEIQQKLDGLNNIIQNDIPLEAQKTVLLDRLKEDEKYLVHSYNNYSNTKKEYEELLKTKTDIPKDILNEIEFHIMPEYLIQQKKQRYMSMLTYISYITAFLSIIPVVRSLGNFSIIFSAYPLIQIFILSMPKDKKKRKKYLKKIIYYTVFIILGIYDFIITIAFSYYWHINDIFLMIAIITYPLFIIMLIIKIIKAIIKTKRNENI